MRFLEFRLAVKRIWGIVIVTCCFCFLSMGFLYAQSSVGLVRFVLKEGSRGASEFSIVQKDDAGQTGRVPPEESYHGVLSDVNFLSPGEAVNLADRTAWKGNVQAKKLPGEEKAEFNFTGLKPKTLYYVYITAYGAGGDSRNFRTQHLKISTPPEAGDEVDPPRLHVLRTSPEEAIFRYVSNRDAVLYWILKDLSGDDLEADPNVEAEDVREGEGVIKKDEILEGHAGEDVIEISDLSAGRGYVLYAVSELGGQLSDLRFAAFVTGENNTSTATGKSLEKKIGVPFQIRSTSSKKALANFKFAYTDEEGEEQNAEPLSLSSGETLYWLVSTGGAINLSGEHIRSYVEKPNLSEGKLFNVTAKAAGKESSGEVDEIEIGGLEGKTRYVFYYVIRKGEAYSGVHSYFFRTLWQSPSITPKGIQAKSAELSLERLPPRTQAYWLLISSHQVASLSPDRFIKAAEIGKWTKNLIHPKTEQSGKEINGTPHVEAASRAIRLNGLSPSSSYSFCVVFVEEESHSELGCFSFQTPAEAEPTTLPEISPLGQDRKTPFQRPPLLYPNPTSGLLYLPEEWVGKKLVLCTSSGELAGLYYLGSGSELDLRDLSSGLYFLRDASGRDYRLILKK
ncbi:MAG: T9SS type A sorting domain-containing protein [Cytophagales bacterium]|nr:T9SS type A sorting domain-containing protein [Cytophagales bacterium]